jgi:hypothetical protein
MMLKRFLPYSAAIAVAFLPGLLRADIDSSAGLSTCFLTALGACNYNTSGTQSTEVLGTVSTNLPGTTVAITNIDSAWQPNNPVTPGTSVASSAVWIGFPVYQISDTFTATAGQALLLDVWADDSVSISVNGVKDVVGTATTGTSACSGVVVGCTPGFPPAGDGGAFSLSNLVTGTNSIVFDVYQTGSGTTSTQNPTGLLFTGTVVSTPEPGSVSMLLAMLVGVAGFAGILKKKLA